MLALIAQILLGATVVWGAVTGFQFIPIGPGATPAGAVPPPRAHAFDAPAALAWARRQVALGPRPAGSPAERRAGEMLRRALPGGHFEPVPGGLRNVAGRIGAGGRAPILLIAHYDTTPVPGYVGANNAAAAVGAVIELARALRAHPAPRGARPVRFLLTDGEEAPTYPPPDFLSEGLRGSRADAARGPRPAAVIVLDFIGQRGLRIPREQGSDPALWARLRATARRVGTLPVFTEGIRGQIYDDHYPYARRGVPAIDLIDFDYPCWQRRCDTLDKLSVRSIDAVGETVLALVRELRTARRLPR